MTVSQNQLGEEVQRRVREQLANAQIQIEEHIQTEVQDRLVAATMTPLAEDWVEVAEKETLALSLPQQPMTGSSGSSAEAVPLPQTAGPPQALAPPLPSHNKLLRPKASPANLRPPVLSQAMCQAGPTEEVPMPRTENSTFLPVFTDMIQTASVQLPTNVRDVEHWGEAIVQFGKYKGKTYNLVPEDKPYVRWLMPRKNHASPAMKDLQQYVMLWRQTYE